MHVLICDDDATVRLIVKRTLEEHLGCTTRECVDGVEALAVLAEERFTFAMLDVDMPNLNGIETLEEIREAEATRDLPVIILSGERDESTVVKLLRLGVADYLLKPLRPTALKAKVDTLVQMLPPEHIEAGPTGEFCLAPDRPALIVDGDLDFRFFFASQAAKFGPIVQAESGAAALAAFRRSPCDIVFVGSNLGVMSPERVVMKLREARPTGVRIIKVVEAGQEETVSRDTFDDVLAKSYLPETFRESLRPFVSIPGPYSAFCGLVPGLVEMVTSASRQVFGMMFQADIRKATSTKPLPPTFSALLELRVAERFVVEFGVFLPESSARESASRMLGIPGEELGAEELESVAGEIGNLLTGRLHAHFRERSLASAMGLPKLSTGGTVPKITPEAGMFERFMLPGADDFVVSLAVRDLLEEGNAAASLTPEAASA